MKLRVDGMPARAREWWMAGAFAGMVYGGMLMSAALEVPPDVAGDASLAGRLPYQPLFKSAMALLLARAAWFHPFPTERRWLVLALLDCAIGDLLLALPGLSFSFVGGLGAFLLAHLAYLALLLPLAGDFRAHRVVGCGAVLGVAGTLLLRFWPNLGTLTMPVAVYIAALSAMVCAALVARLPTPLAALGALSFAVSDALLGSARFLVPFATFQIAIWWTYAVAQLLLVAGIVAGRAP